MARLSRTLAAALVAAVLALATLPGEAAAAPVVHEKVATAAASAFTSECVEDRRGTVCTDTSLSVFSIDGMAQACLFLATFELSRRGEASFESGCAPVGEGGFTIDTKRLSGAALVPTVITLERFECDRRGCNPAGTRDVTVAADFVGVGDLATLRANSKVDVGDCSFFFNGKAVQRQADTSITLDGQTLGAFGFLFASNEKFKIICN